MSAVPKQYEGTWEDILSHSDELIGRRVRLIVVESTSAAAGEEAALLAEYHALVDLELSSKLSAQQSARLAEIEDTLDANDIQRPSVQLFQAKIEDGNRKLDEILAVLSGKSE